MRRHSSLAVTSAIVMVGGVGVFGGGALGPRASAISNHPKSVRTTPLRRRAMTQVRRTSETASLLRDDPVARTLPYLIVDHPRRPGRSVVRRPHLLARPAATEAQWRALRTCESGDSYGMDTGNGYYGAYQFALATWWALGYQGLPNEAPAVVQDRAALRLQRISGWSAWPVCSIQVGL
ncbi:MAG: transglycosylase family protein [Acidimicrobiales bacterium]|jgi:hypothetical protein